jgi:GDP-mannose 6-dehydrogenase
MNISIFGLGYVGCISAGCLAKLGHSIIGVDLSTQKVDQINRGEPTIIEESIDGIIADGHGKGKITATTITKNAVIESEVSIICVGTPSGVNGHLDLSAVQAVSEQIGLALLEKNSFHTIIIRSTVMPGTNSKITESIAKISGKKPNIDFAVVSNPEFLREGSAVLDYFNPSITVIGSTSEKARLIVKELYKDVKGEIEITTPEVAEMIKYVNNSFHALKICFANEVGNVAAHYGLDSHELMDLFSKDTKLNISSRYLKPGFAYGGSCLPKDLKGLQTMAHDAYINTPLLNSISRSNANHLSTVLTRIDNSNKKKIGLIGLTFKPGTDDLRHSPSVALVEALTGKGYVVKIFDENIQMNKIIGQNKSYIETSLPHISDLLVNSLNELVNKTELIVITQAATNLETLIQEEPSVEFFDVCRAIKNVDMFDNLTGLSW